jgi:hypothetical protein
MRTPLIIRTSSDENHIQQLNQSKGEYATSELTENHSIPIHEKVIIIDITEERALCRPCGEIGDMMENSPGNQCLVSLLFEEVATWQLTPVSDVPGMVTIQHYFSSAEQWWQFL